MKGIFINVDSSSDRRSSMEAGLVAAGFSLCDFLRLPGIVPLADEAHLGKGLRSRGELGCWLSHLEALHRISIDDFDPVVHVMEDDNDFAEGYMNSINSILNLMNNSTQLSEIDIVFVDYLLNASLFENVWQRSSTMNPGQVKLAMADRTYLACTSSFLVRKSSAQYILSILAKIFRSASKVHPIDLTLRGLINLGAIKGLISIPTLNAPSWDLDSRSIIQEPSNKSRRIAQRAHLLLRILAAKTETPQWCYERLSDLVSIKGANKANANVEDFLSLWRANSGQIEILF